MNLRTRLISVVRNYWDLGFTAFGGPPVHFIILKDRFVKKLKWIDEGTVSSHSSLLLSAPAYSIFSTKNSLPCVSLSQAQRVPSSPMPLASTVVGFFQAC